MSSTNIVIVTARLGADPELRYLPSGKAVCELRLAVDTSYTKGGERVEDTCWIDATCWERQAETAAKYLSKGSHVLVEGRLRMEVWEKDGNARSKISLTAHRVQFLDPRENAQEGPQDAAGGPNPRPDGSSSTRAHEPTQDNPDALPF